MARPLRIEFRGALYHVTSRGDGRDAIYLADKDRVQYLDVLAQVCDRFAAYASGGYSMKDIGEHFELHYSRISRITNNGGERQKTRPIYS